MRKSELQKEFNVMNWTEEQCTEYLAENYGFRGVDGCGLTRDVKNRTIGNMRLEVLYQMEYNSTL